MFFHPDQGLGFECLAENLCDGTKLLVAQTSNESDSIRRNIRERFRDAELSDRADFGLCARSVSQDPTYLRSVNLGNRQSLRKNRVEKMVSCA